MRVRFATTCLWLALQARIEDPQMSITNHEQVTAVRPQTYWPKKVKIFDLQPLFGNASSFIEG